MLCATAEKPFGCNLPSTKRAARVGVSTSPSTAEPSICKATTRLRFSPPSAVNPPCQRPTRSGAAEQADEVRRTNVNHFTIAIVARVRVNEAIGSIGLKTYSLYKSHAHAWRL